MTCCASAEVSERDRAQRRPMMHVKLVTRAPSVIREKIARPFESKKKKTAIFAIA